MDPASVLRLRFSAYSTDDNGSAVRDRRVLRTDYAGGTGRKVRTTVPDAGRERAGDRGSVPSTQS
jgi:hypothetical protein